MVRYANLKSCLCAAVMLTSGTALMAQKKHDRKDTAAPALPKLPIPAAAKTGPKPYREVVTAKAKTEKGLFLVHKVEDRYLLEIPDAMMKRDYLVMTRVARSGVNLRASNSMAGYAGDEVNANVISFEKTANNKIFMLRKSYNEVSADSTQQMYMAVSRSNMQPVAASFDVKAAATDSNGVVIDITDFISGDNDVFHFPASEKKNWKLGGYQSDKSYVSGVSSFPLNTNIRTVKTFARSGGSDPLASAGTVTLELNTSIVVLPEVPMKPRYFDPRVGYFAFGQVDFDKNPQGIRQLSITKRWRLEPRPEDVEKYKRGELVEPQKPIVIYIDPATPAKWVPYLIQGVNDWQAAFEQAGFKNAISARKAPTPQEDPSWSMDDARHSVIVYKPSAVANASGPSTADPRSGEILETHINWYHNVMELLRNWYMIQAGAVDPRARKMEFDEELMGQLIRFVSSHEVGHTLGLRHNFGSSSTVPVEKLRDKKWVEANGHTPSIMDYARFNYVAQPEDNISEKGIFPRIGDYDKWAIEWGYRWTEKDVETETADFAKLTTAKQSNKRLWFGTEINRDDPRSQNEDLGDNAMLAGTYGIKNLKRIMANLESWTAVPNESLAKLAQMYNQVANQYLRYVGHVVKNVGGQMETPNYIEQGVVMYEYVPKSRQKEAMEWLNTNVINPPEWLLPKEYNGKIGLDRAAITGKIHDALLDKLLDNRVFEKLSASELELGSAGYTAAEMLSDLKGYIWSDLKTTHKSDVYRRNLQKNYIGRLEKILNPPPAAAPNPALSMLAAMFGGASSVSDKGDGFSIIKASAKALRSEIKQALPLTADKLTRYHLEDMADRLGKMLDPK